MTVPVSRVSFSFVILLIFTLKSTNSYRLSTEEKSYVDEFSFKEQPESGSVHPPPIDEPALMARFIVNQAEWAALATRSTRPDVYAYPIVNVKSVSDGALENGSGIPYMYLTKLGFSAKDLAKDNRASLLMTLAQGSYCKDEGMDPMDPRCPRVILTGRVKEVEKSSAEYEVAKKAIFERHPWLAHMPEDHGFYFAKLDIETVAVLADYGPVRMVSPRDYFDPPTA